MVTIYNIYPRMYNQRVMTASIYQKKVLSDDESLQIYSNQLQQRKDIVQLHQNVFLKDNVRNLLKGFLKETVDEYVKDSLQSKLQTFSFNSSELKRNLKRVNSNMIALQLRQDNFQRQYDDDKRKSANLEIQRRKESQQLWNSTRKLKEQLAMETSKRIKLLQRQREIEKHLKIKNDDKIENEIAKKEKENNAMLSIHNKVFHKMSELEIKMYYEKERISQKLYGDRVLDVKRDRKTLMSLFPGPAESRYRITDQLRVKLNVTKKKMIFVRGFNVNTKEKFESDKCNVNQCLITTKMSDLKRADAIYSERKIPSSFYMDRKPENVFVFFQIEGSHNYPIIGVNLLNWTATYRRDSVLSSPYEHFVPFLNITDLPKQPIRNYALGKTKKVAWFVSYCAVSNNRLAYARALQQFIDVDIFGRCGSFKCPTSLNLEKCFQYLNKDYKFYLSFENCNCKDYVTEKFFTNGLK